MASSYSANKEAVLTLCDLSKKADMAIHPVYQAPPSGPPRPAGLAGKLVIALGMLLLICLLLAACSAISGKPVTSGTPASQGASGSGSEATKTAKPDNDKAVAAFDRLLPVFQSPRCANCHGAIDVFEVAQTNRHPGGVGHVRARAEHLEELPGLSHGRSGAPLAA